jgi:hypothetical protein
MSKKEVQLTSVKVDTKCFEEFKINAIKYKYSLNKLVNSAIHLYNTDEIFRKQVTNHIIEDEK